ncbi:MAG: 3D-(3,5/4)-trihydroxycyclohexane-1,2-dione acylhydrolase (decyclizing) [Ectothiorhodospiraceae bacterium]|nr:3D-(3,5/4)-trihydroxycyclohexane-1,2-dione acylhydrolase (decyclizing) [Ectothiorhodospiraceae bacterium]
MTIRRLTTAQAIVQWMCAQQVETEAGPAPVFAGVFAIFGHGNVTGLGEALAGAGDRLPTLRAHNEQAMALAATAFAKAWRRRRLLACTTSIGPGATNMVTAAAVAHVNRLPLLLLPGDVFASRRPDPVLQQVERFGEPEVTANDCFRPVSRYFDRVTRPEQILASLPAALRVLLDPAECGPATIALPQDVQAEAWDFPEAFFATRVHHRRRPPPDPAELDVAVRALRSARRPLIVAGGGVHYALACDALASLAAATGVPVAETQAGKGALPHDHVAAVGAIGVTGSAAANALAREADLVLAIGTRLADFTTGSRALLPADARLVTLNVASFDAAKHDAMPVVADAGAGIDALAAALDGWRAPPSWTTRATELARDWDAVVERVTAPGAGLATDAQVLGAVWRASDADDVVVCAAGGLPGELHRLWRARRPGSYHLEYGYSCMGYEIAGGLGVRLAREDGEVFVLVGDGSYLMLNSELATSVMLGAKLVVVVLDNGGFGCIDRLQRACGAESFNNLFARGVRHGQAAPKVDFAAHAAALGAMSERVDSIAALEAALVRARAAERTYVIAIDTDPRVATAEGGAWWDVPVAEVSDHEAVREASRAYRDARRRRDL